MLAGVNEMKEVRVRLGGEEDRGDRGDEVEYTIKESPPKIENAKLVGRPPGSKRDPSLPIKYPIGWKVVYDQMIMYYLQGRTYKEIGELVGYTEIQVGNIVRSPQGQAVLGEISKGIKDFQKEIVLGEAEKSERLRAKVLDKMENFVENKGIEELSPLHFVDRVIKIANTVNGVGGRRVESVTNVQNTQNIQNNTLVVSSEAVSALTKALEASTRLGLPTKDKGREIK